MDSGLHPSFPSGHDFEMLLLQRVREDMQEIALRERELLREMLEIHFNRFGAMQQQSAKEYAVLLQTSLDSCNSTSASSPEPDNTIPWEVSPAAKKIFKPEVTGSHDHTLPRCPDLVQTLKNSLPPYPVMLMST